MKKIYGFAALCAAMTLASCSNENEPNVPVVGEKVDGYVSISINAAGGNTRATYDTGKTDGSESKVEKGVIILFDKSDRLVSVNDFVPSFEANFDGEEETAPNVSHISTDKAVKVKDNATEETKATKMMVVLNMSSTDLGAATSGETVTTISNKIKGCKNGDNFIMSNSNYGAGTTTVAVTTYQEAKDAPANPVNVYVERLAARVDYVFKATSDFGKSDVTISIDGATEAALGVEVKGLKIFNEATTSYLVKALPASKPSGLSAWIDTDAKRSHWADCAKRGGDSDADLTFVGQTSWNGLATGFTYNTTLLDKYVCENTRDEATTMVLGVTLNSGNTFYRAVFNNKFYTQANIKKAFITEIADDEYWKSTDGVTYNTLGEGDLDIVSSRDLNKDEDLKASVQTNTGYDGYIQISLADGVNLYKRTIKNDGTAKYDPISEVEANKALLAATVEKADGSSIDNTLYKYRVYKWNGGAAYYTATFNPTEQGLAGIVRNHIYQMNLNGIAGLGVPVWDPTEDIVIETPDPVDPKTPEKYYIDCNINILSWTYYSQNVTFK